MRGGVDVREEGKEKVEDREGGERRGGEAQRRAQHQPLKTSLVSYRRNSLTCVATPEGESK
jgi:hypothetical protein